MDAPLWIQLVSTLAPALIGATPPAIALWLGARTAGDRSIPRRRRRGRVAWTAAAATAGAASVAAGFIAPLGWLWPLAGFALVGASAFAITLRRNAKRPLLAPAVQAFTELHNGTGGFPYDREHLPELIRGYTGQELATTPDRDAEEHRRLRLEWARRPKPESPQATRLSIEAILSDRTVRHVVVTGEAGVGKSSLLSYLSHVSQEGFKDLTVRDSAAKAALPGLVPVQIAARHLIGKQSVAVGFGDDAEALLSAPPAPKAQWLIMIDALDEVPDADDRSAVAHLVYKAMDKAGPWRFVLTSRDLNQDLWRGFRHRGTIEFQLQPFTDEQLRSFLVARCVSSRERLQDPNVRAWAEARTDRFIERMSRSDNLIELLRLPLLARVAAAIYFEEEGIEELPARRVDIYRDAVDHWLRQFQKRLQADVSDEGKVMRLLDKWKASRPAASQAESLKALLSEIADRHLDDDTTTIDDHACAMLGVRLRPKNSPERQAVTDLLSATGLILEAGTGQPRFLHRTFAEYLAAPLRLDRYADLNTWSEALELVSTRPAAVFALDCLAAGDLRELVLDLSSDSRTFISAGWLLAEGLCVDATGQPDSETRDQVLDRLFEELPRNRNNRPRELLSALVSVGDVRKRMAAALTDPRFPPIQRMEFAAVLAPLDERSRLLLLSMSSDTMEEDQLRIEAAEALALSDRTLAVELLHRIAVGSTVSEDSRLDAARALTNLGEGQAVDLLVGFAGDHGFDYLYRIFAAEEVARQAPELGAELLRALADDLRIEPIGRIFASDYLCAYAPDAGVERLKNLASDQSLSMNLRGYAISDLASRDGEAAAVALRSLIAEEQQDPDSYVDLVGPIVSLVQTDVAAGMELLVELSADADSPQQASAAQSLAEHDRDRGVAQLQAIAADRARTPYLRVHAAQALAPYDAPAAAEFLHAFIGDAAFDTEDRVFAARGLAQFDATDGRNTLLEIARSHEEEPWNRVEAAEALGGYDRDTAIAELAHLAEDGSLSYTSRVSAAEQLAAMSWWEGAELMLRIIPDKTVDPVERITAVNSLKYVSSRHAAKAYAAIAADPELPDEQRQLIREKLAGMGLPSDETTGAAQAHSD